MSKCSLCFFFFAETSAEITQNVFFSNQGLVDNNVLEVSKLSTSD